MKVSTKFKVDTTIRCLVIALFLLIRYMTLWPWPWPLTFWPWSVVIDGGSRGQYLYGLKILRLSILELWILTSPVGYHWQCICSHCACAAILRDLCVGGKFFPHICNLWTQFAYSLYSFYGATIKINGVNRQNSLLPTRLTQSCIPLGSLNRVPASAGVKAGMSRLPSGR